MPWKSKLTMCKKEFLSSGTSEVSMILKTGDYHFDSWLHYSEDSRFRQIQNLQKAEAKKRIQPSRSDVPFEFKWKEGRLCVTALARNRTIEPLPGIHGSRCFGPRVHARMKLKAFLGMVKGRPVGLLATKGV